MPKSRRRQNAKPRRRSPGGRPPSLEAFIDSRAMAVLDTIPRDTEFDSPAEAEALASELLGLRYQTPLPLDLRPEADRLFGPRLILHLADHGRAGLALLRAVAALVEGPVTEQANAAADRLAALGVAEPRWAGVVGHPEFLDAWVLGDPWDDQRGYFATFQYPDDDPHMAMALYDRNLGGIIKDASLSPGPFRAADVPLDHGSTLTEVDPAEMAATVLAAIAIGDRYVDNDWTEDFHAFRAVLAARMRTLPPATAPVQEPVDEEALLDAFMAASRLPDDDLHRAPVRHALWFRGGDEALVWSPISVDQFMLDFLPRKVSLDADDVRVIPTVLKAWVRFCLTRRGVDEPWIAETEQAVDENAAEFRTAATDATRFGTAKRIGQALQDAGVDLGNPEALAGWMNEFNARPFEERDAALTGLGFPPHPDGGADVDLPDLPDFTWGPDPGPTECQVRADAAAYLAHHASGGNPRPAGRGNKRRAEGLLQDFLAGPLEGPGGRSRRDAVHLERADAWLDAFPGTTRRALLEPFAAPGAGPVPEGAVLPNLTWLLDRFAEGVPLTQTGNLGQKFVQEAAGRFGWDFERPPRTEDDLYLLARLREHAQKQLGLARRSGRQVVLTARGKELLGDPQRLWAAVARKLVPAIPFERLAGELFLGLLASGATLDDEVIAVTVATAALEAGFVAASGEPVDRGDASWAIMETQALCAALGVLEFSGPRSDRQVALVGSGPALARAALHFLATGG